MSIHSASDVGGRVAAAGDEASSPADGSLRSSSDLAAAIERLAALIAADVGAARDGSAALERITDIAFVLHERDVEASLCDALDAAVRELVQADQLQQANAESAQQALASLRELVRRIDGTVAATQVGQGTEARRAVNESAAKDNVRTSTAADYDTVEDAMRRDDLFLAVAQEDDALSHTVTPLSASLPVGGEPAEITAMPLNLQALPDPNEDPGDLFEPLAGDTASGRNEPTPTVEASAPVRLAVQRDALSNTIEPPSSADAAAASQRPPATPGPEHDDPLALLRALSEEELIALFS